MDSVPVGPRLPSFLLAERRWVTATGVAANRAQKWKFGLRKLYSILVFFLDSRLDVCEV